VSDQFYSGPADLAHSTAVKDAWDAQIRDDSKLASWAFVNTPEPMTERQLGAFAAWAVEVCDYPVS
jgi:hypothetical protein